METLGIGDIVRRSGVPPMIIERYDTESVWGGDWSRPAQWIEDLYSFVCTWWEDEVRYQDLFSVYQLEKKLEGLIPNMYIQIENFSSQYYD